MAAIRKGAFYAIVGLGNGEESWRLQCFKEPSSHACTGELFEFSRIMHL